MCCGNSSSIKERISIKSQHKEILSTKLNFDKVKLDIIYKLHQKDFAYLIKDEGYRYLIEESMNTLNKALEGAFLDSIIKESVVLKLIFFFFNNNSNLSETNKKITINKNSCDLKNYDNFDIQKSKECFFKEYFILNKYNILSFWYSIQAIPRVFSYLLVQSLTPILLPNKEKDLVYFFGGHSVEGYHGSQSVSYVNCKISEYYPNCSINRLEEIIKENIFSQSNQTYITEMIIKEKEYQINPEKFGNDKIEISIEFIDNICSNILNYSNPYKLLDYYIAT